MDGTGKCSFLSEFPASLLGIIFSFGAVSTCAIKVVLMVAFPQLGSFDIFRFCSCTVGILFQLVETCRHGTLFHRGRKLAGFSEQELPHALWGNFACPPCYGGIFHIC